MTVHTEVGAYSMGLLDERDRRAFEDHLAGCESCAAELAELSPMAALLKGVDPVGAAAGAPAGTADPQAGGADVTQLIHRRVTRQRQHRRWQVVAGAAAGIVLIGGGIGIGVAAASQHGGPGAPAVAIPGQLHSATDPGTGVAGTVGLRAKAWGTVVTLDLSKVHGPVECELGGRVQDRGTAGRHELAGARPGRRGAGPSGPPGDPGRHVHPAKRPGPGRRRRGERPDPAVDPGLGGYPGELDLGKETGSLTRFRKNVSICRMASMKCSKSTGLLTNALACSE